jgi:hypothetical protein
MKIINEGATLVFGDNQKSGETGKYFIFSSGEVCSDGSVIVCGLEKVSMKCSLGKTVVKRSFDGCKTFSDVTRPAQYDEEHFPDYSFLNNHITEIAPGEFVAVYLLVHADPGKPLFHPETDGIQFARVRTCKSYDNGKTWTKPRNLEKDLPDIIVPGKPFLCADGSIGFPSEVHHEWDKGFREGPSARFIKSYDRGETFSEINMIVLEKDVIHGDARLTRDEDNNIVAFFWKFDSINSLDLPVHKSVSKDCGKTWDIPYPTTLVSQITSPLYFKKGLMLGITQDRMSIPSAIKAYLSYDEGMSWDLETCEIVFNGKIPPVDGDAFKSFDQYQFGYSWLIKTGENRAIAVYWHANENNTRSISVTKLLVSE